MVATREVHPVADAGLTRLADARPSSSSLGLYVHVPFCAKRCYYCSFNTAPLDLAALARYLAAVDRELALLAALPWAGSISVATVFFGGGTPSLLSAEALAGVLAALSERFTVAEVAEITVECNPESVTRDKLEGYRRAGVNRVSLGVQSLDDTILPGLGRLHSAAGARAAFEATREAGLTNVSVDLMYGLPGLAVEDWRRAVQAVLAWHPEHLSAYGLTLDEGSLWGTAGPSGLPPEATVVEQYWALAREAAAHGYEHYEISNYARAGFRSAHNHIYWRAEEYLACGPGGCGFVGDLRYGNAKPVPRYAALVEDGRLPIETAERLTDRQRLAERLVLGLRTLDGVPRALLDTRTQGDPGLTRRFDSFRQAGLLVDRGDRVALTEAGFLVSDEMFVHLL